MGGDSVTALVDPMPVNGSQRRLLVVTGGQAKYPAFDGALVAVRIRIRMMGIVTGRSCSLGGCCLYRGRVSCP